jgi:hypothetical protein
MRAFAERVHHSPHRLVEHDPDRGLQNAAAKLEIDEEVDFGPAVVGRELPLVVQVAEGAVLVFDRDPVRPVERDAAGKAFSKWPKADCQVGQQVGLGAVPNPGRNAPR